jgi:hypothetical protein
MCYSVPCAVEDCDNFAHCGIGVCDDHMQKFEYLPELYAGPITPEQHVY